MDIDSHIAALRLAGSRLSYVAAAADLDADVPSCPGWTMRDLVRHVGGIHRWATRYVGEARVEVIDEDLDELVGGWPPDQELLAWFAKGHRKLVATLAGAPAELECFTFLEAPSPLAMWARRQAHETSIHRLDAELACAATTGFAAELAVDGIDELLTAFITRPGRGPRADLPTSLAVMPTDDGARWIVRFDADGCRTERVAADADATVSGSASDLYMWVWNRPSIGEVVATGNASVLESWRDTVHIRWG